MAVCPQTLRELVPEMADVRIEISDPDRQKQPLVDCLMVMLEEAGSRDDPDQAARVIAGVLDSLQKDGFRHPRLKRCRTAWAALVKPNELDGT